MEQKVEEMIQAQAGMQAQLAAVNSTLQSLPQSIAAALAGTPKQDEVVIEQEPYHAQCCFPMLDFKRKYLFGM